MSLDGELELMLKVLLLQAEYEGMLRPPVAQYEAKNCHIQSYVGRSQGRSTAAQDSRG